MTTYMWSVGAAVVLILVIAAAVIFVPRPAVAPEGSPSVQETNQPTVPPAAIIPNQSAPVTERTLAARTIPGADPAFTFSAAIPAKWEVEAVPATQAINLYDPATAGDTNLEKSQIFIRFFEANDFLTLSTVIIHQRQELTVAGRPAVEYDIEKRAGVANFPNQPAWRSARHMVTDVRVSDSNPSVFYVIARRPDLDEAIYQRFLNTLQVNAAVAPTPAGSELQEPIAQFRNRITKKPFGIYITPATSPIQPERFEGYHTAVDVEYEDIAGDVPVKAIAAGTVAVSRNATGYGGVVVLRHTIRGESVLSLYGHLDPNSRPSVGASIQAGQQIGVLGEGGTAETDGERKHLHFGIFKGTNADLRGYVQNQFELSAWHDPLEFL